MMKENTATANRFDCDGSCLIKSPCRECDSKKGLPGCSEGCEILHQVQAFLVGIISCSKSCSDLEDYSLSWPSR